MKPQLMPYAYKSGKNPWAEDSRYYCHDCGLELLGEEVGYVAAGTIYANGEFCPCPMCRSENSVDRGEE